MKMLSCMVYGNMVVITVFYINKHNENLELYGAWKYGCHYCVLHKINNENRELYGVWKHGCDYCVLHK